MCPHMGIVQRYYTPAARGGLQFTPQSVRNLEVGTPNYRHSNVPPLPIASTISPQTIRSHLTTVLPYLKSAHASLLLRLVKRVPIRTLCRVASCNLLNGAAHHRVDSREQDKTMRRETRRDMGPFISVATFDDAMPPCRQSLARKQRGKLTTRSLGMDV